MGGPRLKIGCFRYEATAALFDGSVTVEGAHVSMETVRTIPEIFERMMRDHEFDVSELGLTFYLRTFGDDSPFIAIPVFPNRVFRHSRVFVNVDSGITEPSNFVGKTIGEFGMYSQDSGVLAKGILMGEYGFRPELNRWIIGGLDDPAPPFDFVPQTHPADVDVAVAPEALGPDAGGRQDRRPVKCERSAVRARWVTAGAKAVSRLRGRGARLPPQDRNLPNDAHHRHSTRLGGGGTGDGPCDI